MNDTFQNQDLNNQNPLHTPENVMAKATSKFKFPTDPKMKLLVILGIIVGVLLIIALITSLFRKGPVAPRRVEPTPTTATTPIPTIDTKTSNMPPEIEEKFKQIDSNINTTVNYNPPQIDPEIGL